MSQCDQNLLEPYLSMILGARGLFRKGKESSALCCASLAYLYVRSCLHHTQTPVARSTPMHVHDDLVPCACLSSPQRHFHARQREYYGSDYPYDCFCRVHCLRCHQRLSWGAADSTCALLAKSAMTWHRTTLFSLPGAATEHIFSG